MKVFPSQQRRCHAQPPFALQHQQHNLLCQEARHQRAGAVPAVRCAPFSADGQGAKLKSKKILQTNKLTPLVSY